MCRHEALAELYRHIERQPAVAFGFGDASPQMKIVCDKRFGIDVNGTEFAQKLRMGGHPAIGFAGCADLEHRSADRTADGTLDEGQVLVANKHCPSQHAD